MKLKQLAPYISLHRDSSGIAWVQNGTVGLGHSCHPNIDESGSVKGMIARGYWPKDARPVKSRGFIYNTSAVVTSDEYDEIARQNCQCGGKH